MEKTSQIKLTQPSVTNFLYCGDEYLFLKRNKHAKINAGEMNGIGGKVEPNENYLEAAIRETEEETGYKVSPDDISFCGLIHFTGGYAKDWITGFFKIKVPHKSIPLGSHIKEGELFWIHKDKVLNNGHTLVDDIQYIFQDIINEKEIFFMAAEVGGNELKILKHSTHKIKNPSRNL
jgi:8-oxo-dGTP pyrophosphatase MutT (NUDIX family)